MDSPDLTEDVEGTVLSGGLEEAAYLMDGSSMLADVFLEIQTEWKASEVSLERMRCGTWSRFRRQAKQGRT